jgi:hypothetical protein
VRPLGERHRIPACELLTGDVGGLTLSAWGAGYGDEFVIVGTKSQARLCCAFSWEEINGFT